MHPCVHLAEKWVHKQLSSILCMLTDSYLHATVCENVMLGQSVLHKPQTGLNVIIERNFMKQYNSFDAAACKCGHRV